MAFLFYLTSAAEAFDSNLGLKLVDKFYTPDQLKQIVGALRDAPTEIKLREGQSIYVIGDIHADYSSLRRILNKIGAVTDEGFVNHDFTDHILFLGDILNKGHEDRRVLETYALMNSHMAKLGGTWTLAGNHEVETMRLALDGKVLPERFVKPKGMSDFQEFANSDGESGRTVAFGMSGLFRKILATSNIVMIGGKTLFVHAGLTPEALFSTPGNVHALNHAARLWMRAGGQVPDLLQRTEKIVLGNGVRGLGIPIHRFLHRITGRSNQFEAQYEEAVRRAHYDSISPLWSRRYSNLSRGLYQEDEVCRHLDTVLSYLGLKRMMVGHEPQLNGPSMLCDGRLVLLDTYISEAFDGDEEIRNAQRHGTYRHHVAKVFPDGKYELLNFEEPKN